MIMTKLMLVIIVTCVFACYRPVPKDYVGEKSFCLSRWLPKKGLAKNDFEGSLNQETFFVPKFVKMLLIPSVIKRF